jgi:hypothetical protein
MPLYMHSSWAEYAVLLSDRSVGRGGRPGRLPGAQAGGGGARGDGGSAARGVDRGMESWWWCGGGWEKM